MEKNEFFEEVIIQTQNRRPIYSIEQIREEAEKEKDWIMSFYDEVMNPNCRYYNNFEEGVSVASLNFSMLI